MYFSRISGKQKTGLQVSILLLFCLGVSCVQSTNLPTSQVNVANVATLPRGYNGNLQGTVESSGDTFLYQAESIEEAIGKTTLATLSLAFPASTNNDAQTIELPEQAMSALDAYFKAYLRYCFIDNPRGPKYAPENFEVDRALLRNFQKAIDAVVKVKIIAPDGQREISNIEAERLVARVVIEAIKTWKASNNQ